MSKPSSSLCVKKKKKTHVSEEPSAKNIRSHVVSSQHEMASAVPSSGSYLSAYLLFRPFTPTDSEQD